MPHPLICQMQAEARPSTPTRPESESNGAGHKVRSGESNSASVALIMMEKASTYLLAQCLKFFLHVWVESQLLGLVVWAQFCGPSLWAQFCGPSFAGPVVWAQFVGPIWWA